METPKNLPQALLHVSKGVCILGSCNIDYFLYVDEFVKPGQTIHSNELAKNMGGKGLNQALQIGKLTKEDGIDQQAHMFIGCTGCDAESEKIHKTLRGLNFRNVDSHLRRIEGTNTGHANIIVNSKGENQIILAPEANFKITKEMVDESLEKAAKSCQIFLAQAEIPIEITVYALEKAKKAGLFTIFNPAPSANIPSSVWKYCDIVCPNESEISEIVNKPITSMIDAAIGAQELRKLGTKVVIVTLGEQGVVVVSGPNTIRHIKPHKVKVVDTTGAGDCFLGSLAYFLSCEIDLMDACTFANYIAGLSVTKKGCSPSYPTRNQLMNL